MAEKKKNMVRRRLVRSYITSVISIAMVLTMVGVAAIFWVNAGEVAGYFKENVTCSLLLKEHISEMEGVRMADSLGRCETVRSSVFISKMQGEKELKELLGEDFLDVFESTPVPSSIDLKFYSDKVNTQDLAILKAEFEKDGRIAEVAYQASLVDALNTNLNKITLILTIVIILLFVISFALINNTVRLNLYSRRFTIHTMRLVGARNAFIRKPFLRQAVVQGFVSGSIAAAILYGGVCYLKYRSELLFSIIDINTVWFTLAGLILSGIVICMISAFFVVSRLTYSSKDDLYF